MKAKSMIGWLGIAFLAGPSYGQSPSSSNKRPTVVYFLVNLDTDPNERGPYNYPYLQTWVGAHVARVLGDYQASVKREPLIPVGAPLDFVPRAKQP